MFQHILVTLDGSKRAEQAIPVAAQIAHITNGSLHLLRVIHLPEAFETDPIESEVHFEFSEAREYLEKVSCSSNLAGVQVHSEVKTGETVQTILSEIESQRINLVVMSSHGYTGMIRWKMGSTAERVAQHSPAPVFLLRGNKPRVSVDEISPLRILVPLDGSSTALAAINPAIQLLQVLSQSGKGSLHLTRVVVMPDIASIHQSERSQIIQEAREYLHTIVQTIRTELKTDSLQHLDLATTWSVTIDDDIAGGIIRVAEDGEDAEGAGVFGRSDIIAMATHEYNGPGGTSMGIITERVLQASSCPILLVRLSE